MKRRGVWWLLGMNHDMNKELIPTSLQHFMDPVNGSNAKGRRPIGMCCLHVGGLFITGTPDFLVSSRRLSSHSSRLDMKT